MRYLSHVSSAMRPDRGKDTRPGSRNDMPVEAMIDTSRESVRNIQVHGERDAPKASSTRLKAICQLP